jgi:ATP-dependent Clp protease protease subunit
MNNVGGDSSIAVIVFLAGKHRVASDTATFMIHKTHASPPSGATAAVLNEIADSLNVDNDRTETILHRHISMPSEKWDLHHHGSLTITAQEAIQFTLIHEIAPFAPLPGSTLFSI